jgi:predicted RecB family nuclease
MTDEGPIDPTPFDRYVPRRDVSGVRPQGGHAAARCPLRVQFDVYPPDGVVALPLPVGAQLRADEGHAFEVDVVDEVRARHPDSVAVDADVGSQEQQGLTSDAMHAGASVIVGGRLPTDVEGRRAGGPDLLVRAERRPDGRWAYHPIDVKRHLTVHDRPATADVAPVLVTGLDRLALRSAASDPDRTARNRTDDLLQLAHHHRMLEAAGRSAEQAVGGIIGVEREVVWHHLDRPVVRRLWDGSVSAKEAALRRYDLEFSFRLDVIASAAAREPIVEPVLVKECASCPWRGHCLPVLRRSDSTSLLPGISYKPWHALRRQGITTRAELARVDHRSARVRDGVGAELRSLVVAAGLVDPATPVADLVAEGSVASTVLVQHGVATAADLVALDPLAVALAGQPPGRLAEAVHGARVITDGTVAELRHGLGELVVPAADVEIDIDMENAVDGTVYLWGALVDDHYHPFVSWAVPTRTAEAEVFVAFWDWLRDRRAAAAAAGKTLALYCWYQGAEAGALRRGSAAAAELLGRADAPAEVEELLAGPQWVDLYEVVTRQVVTGTSAGLKVVATVAGFAWRDHDPSGEASMAWHAAAVGTEAGGAGQTARARLLAYNEDDVRATAAVRSWLRSHFA